MKCAKLKYPFIIVVHFYFCRFFKHIHPSIRPSNSREKNRKTEDKNKKQGKHKPEFTTHGAFMNWYSLYLPIYSTHHASPCWVPLRASDKHSPQSCSQQEQANTPTKPNTTHYKKPRVRDRDRDRRKDKIKDKHKNDLMPIARIHKIRQHTALTDLTNVPIPIPIPIPMSMQVSNARMNLSGVRSTYVQHSLSVCVCMCS